MTYSASVTETYSSADVEQVFKSFKQELLMIAESSKAMTMLRAEQVGYDAEYLAKNKYLRSVDVTLLDVDGDEVNAFTYTVNTAAGALNSSRVGGTKWPKTSSGSIRVVLSYMPKWHSLTAEARSKISKEKLKRPWGPSAAGTSHSTLRATGGRAFVSSAYGIERQDYSK